MTIYQRYLSKSLIFFSGCCIVFLLFVESNIGFKYFFNLTSRFFLGLRAEEISGSWRNFTLKNIRCDIFGLSIQANSVHIIIDITSLLNFETIFKEIETKNLIIAIKENFLSHSKINKLSSNTWNKNIFIKYPIIFQKIYMNKVLLKTPKINIYLSHVVSSLKLINDNIVFQPTYISTVHVTSFEIDREKKIKKSYVTTINNIYDHQSITHVLHGSWISSKIFIPLNIHLPFLQCKEIHLFTKKFITSFSLELMAHLKKNVLNIRRIKVHSKYISIKSHGKVFFNNHSIICNLNNKIFIPNFLNKIIHLSLQGCLKNKLRFHLQSHDIYKINVYGSILMRDLNHPFYLHLKSKNLPLFIKKKLILELNDINVVFKGTLKKYFLSFRNILNVYGMKSMFLDINGYGNIKNIFFRKIQLFFLNNTMHNKTITSVSNYFNTSQSIFKLLGTINTFGYSHDYVYDLCFPKIDLDGNFMGKKLSILGSLYYKNFNMLTIPGINVLAGTNKLYFKGLLSKKINFYSSVVADNLDYFLPNLKGNIYAESKVYGNYLFPSMNNKIVANDLNWNHLFLKNIEIFLNVNTKDAPLGTLLVNMTKFYFNDFKINSLYIKSHWNHEKQTLSFVFNSPFLYINFIWNGIINHKTGNWSGVFKNVHIKTLFGEFINKKSLVLHFSHSKKMIDNISAEKIKIRNVMDNFLYKSKKYIVHFFHDSAINFNSELVFDSQWKWILGTKLSSAKVLLTSRDIRFHKKNKEKTSCEDINSLKLSINLSGNVFKSDWIINKSMTQLKNSSIFGYLNVMDVYNKQNLEGKVIISNFPVSLVNFFTNNFQESKGVFDGSVKLLGSLYQPQLSSEIHLKNIFIKSDNLLKYITLFLPYFLSKIDHMKINQEILIKTGSIFFTLNTLVNHSNSMEWNLLFNCKKIYLMPFYKMYLKCSSQLHLHYLFEKYDLIGYIRFPFFNFKINEKNFIF